MAKNDAVPLDEEVVRYARPEDFDDGILNGSAFDRPEKDHDGLSVTRLFKFDQNDLAADLRSIRDIMISRRVPLDPDGRFAQINVGEIVAAGQEAEVVFKVLEAPSKANKRNKRLANPAHAIVDGLPFKDAAVGSLTSELASDLLRMRVSQLHLAIEPLQAPELI